MLANAVPGAAELDPALHERVLKDALTAADNHRVTGKHVTPFLLAAFHEATGGASIDTNIALVRNNARLAAQIAIADRARSGCG